MSRNSDKAPPTGPNHGYGGWGKQFRDWITANVPEGSKVLEFGSGIGSRFLADRYDLSSIEHNADWLNVAGESCYIHCPIVAGWYDTNGVKKAMQKQYDLVIIDGPPGTIGRRGILRHLGLFDFAVTFIVDDVNRKPEMEIAEAISKRVGRPFEVHKDELKDFAVI